MQRIEYDGGGQLAVEIPEKGKAEKEEPNFLELLLYFSTVDD